MMLKIALLALNTLSDVAQIEDVPFVKSLKVV
jgi:hypothetical protein